MSKKSASIFYNRKQEEEYILDEIKKVSDGPEQAGKILELYGIPGIGKTSLIANIVKKTRKEFVVPCAIVDFKTTKYHDIVSVIKIVISEIESFSIQIKEAIMDYERTDPTAIDTLKTKEQPISFLFIEELKLLSNKGLLLIFDSMELAEYELLKKLDETILFPFVPSNRVLVLIAGTSCKGWSYDLREIVTPIRLSPLTIEELQENFNCLHFDDVESLFTYSCGHPQAIVELIKSNIENYDRLIQKVLTNILTKMNLTDKFRLLQKLSVLRIFDFNLLKDINEQLPNKKPTNTHLLLEELNQSGVIYYSKHGGFRIDKTLRNMILSWFKRTNKDEFNKISVYAVEKFENKYQGFGLNWERHIVEYLYHRCLIATNDYIIEEAIYHFINIIRRYSDEHQNGDRKSIRKIRNLMWDDLELKDILNDYFHYIMKKL